jgi:hypothetical protein
MWVLIMVLVTAGNAISSQTIPFATDALCEDARESVMTDLPRLGHGIAYYLHCQESSQAAGEHVISGHGL